MSWFGTDIVAVGCILRGAAVGGAVTAAFMDGGEHAHVGCGMEAVAVSPQIAISHRGDAGAIVVMPDVRVHAIRDCVREVEGVVEIHMETHLDQLDVQLEHLDRALEIEVRQLERAIEAELGQEMEARIKFEKAMRQMEGARARVVVTKVQRGGG